MIGKAAVPCRQQLKRVGVIDIITAANLCNGGVLAPPKWLHVVSWGCSSAFLDIEAAHYSAQPGVIAKSDCVAWEVVVVVVVVVGGMR